MIRVCHPRGLIAQTALLPLASANRTALSPQLRYELRMKTSVWFEVAMLGIILVASLVSAVSSEIRTHGASVEHRAERSTGQ
jgi:hypothetical protein